MAIVIKEIKVKVTVESSSRRTDADEETMLRMKEEIVKELKEIMRRESARKNER